MTPDPRISVILNTCRPDYPMLDRPDTWIFEPTIQSLAAQTFKDFELVIVDGLAGKREQPSTPMPLVAQPCRTLPFPTSSEFYNHGYLAISAPKNEALRHCNGSLVVQLDDCCSFGPDFLSIIWKAHTQGFMSACFVDYARGGQLVAPDPRRKHLRGKYHYPGGAYGYTAFPLAAALEINGYDEGFDGSKCLEDANFSARLVGSGHRYRMHRDLSVIEHQHGDICHDAWPVPPPQPKGDRALKCNGVHAVICRERRMMDKRAWLRANTVPYSDQEWDLYGPPCGLYAGVAQSGPYAGQGLCGKAKLPCNWLKVPGQADSGNWIGADPNWEKIREWVPTFDLRAQWEARRLAEGRGVEVPSG